jgi:hypothetical protein
MNSSRRMYVCATPSFPLVFVLCIRDSIIRTAADHLSALAKSAESAKYAAMVIRPAIGVAVLARRAYTHPHSALQKPTYSKQLRNCGSD